MNRLRHRAPRDGGSPLKGQAFPPSTGTRFVQFASCLDGRVSGPLAPTESMRERPTPRTARGSGMSAEPDPLCPPVASGRG